MVRSSYPPGIALARRPVPRYHPLLASTCKVCVRQLPANIRRNPAGRGWRVLSCNFIVLRRNGLLCWRGIVLRLACVSPMISVWRKGCADGHKTRGYEMMMFTEFQQTRNGVDELPYDDDMVGDGKGSSGFVYTYEIGRNEVPCCISLFESEDGGADLYSVTVGNHSELYSRLADAEADLWHLIANMVGDE